MRHDEYGRLFVCNKTEVGIFIYVNETVLADQDNVEMARKTVSKTVRNVDTQRRKRRASAKLDSPSRASSSTVRRVKK